ncbi:MAG: hypothetical protein IAX21_01565 [Candidatus Bathyarchaeota archaeon]|nr:hypothetical protein [Candidatus Bathyarchaeum tardum]WGM90335.1 MAG: hypothetical protein NUK63_04230 [Candidatus Bathyarchaeum tardum]WNZ29586.1 MAG: hypothetical protein IAX21_01565 [Candidatus Bathyarchaeota archaeon]
MPNLGDYLGHLISEITIARMQADIEAVRVAELYSNHPLLKNMPIPHFRLPNVELDVPVVIKNLEASNSEKAPRGAPSLEESRVVFNKVLAKTLSEEKIRLTSVQNRTLKKALDENIVSLTQPKEVSVDLNRVAKELSNTVSENLISSGVDVKTKEKIENKINELARVELLKLRKEPSRLKVLVNTSEIREAGPIEAITRLHLKISEEAFEWTSIESEGKKLDRLVIE